MVQNENTNKDNYPSTPTHQKQSLGSLREHYVHFWVALLHVAYVLRGPITQAQGAKDGVHGALCGYSEIVPSGRLFRVRDCPEWLGQATPPPSGT